MLSDFNKLSSPELENVWFLNLVPNDFVKGLNIIILKGHFLRLERMIMSHLISNFHGFVYEQHFGTLIGMFFWIFKYSFIEERCDP